MSPKRLVTEAAACRECQICALACSLAHEGASSLELARIRIVKDMAAYTFEILVCQQCDGQECVARCPAGAIRPDGNGILVLVEDECIQCQACLDACPSHAIFLEGRSGRILKCDLCRDRPDGPLCARLCPVEAIRVEEYSEETKPS